MDRNPYHPHLCGKQDRGLCHGKKNKEEIKSRMDCASHLFTLCLWVVVVVVIVVDDDVVVVLPLVWSVSML